MINVSLKRSHNVSSSLFVGVGGFIVILTLLNSRAVSEFYLFIARILSVDSSLVFKYALQISECGHVASYLLLTVIGYLVFWWSRVRLFFYVIAIAFISKILQILSPIRKAHFSDIILNMTGIVLALSIISLVTGCYRNRDHAPDGI